ncbi:DUF4118 domain-containing protein [Herbaspirillum sp. RTI4]|uniref:DUF4118 domain-containing protein n=1 Tax=Herbaspirillum sp. RTI4 TaxID=3048640 RepID=UPI002AB53C08|nr:DUF4118 domain-containing protein [Herbaspirillum sp. RTI4]MDY7579399.1 DUF4118 domain-containing protein [Herbaspirillum sp. RTI4]MEA9980313.1 DUF4118 domain-containing protein [Herbaspirillum sp. RTI4]
MSSITFRNAKRWRPTGFLPVIICACGFTVAFAIRFALSPFVGESLSMLFFWLNCIVMSFLFGYAYSLVLLSISLPTALFFFRQPYYAVSDMTHADYFLIIMYSVTCILTTIIIEWLQRERYVAKLQQRVSETRYQLLIESDQARRAEYAKQFINVSEATNSPDTRIIPKEANQG